MQDIELNKFQVTPDNSLAIMIDMQTTLINAMNNNQALLANTLKLIAGLNILNIPILYTEQSPEKLGHTALELQELINPNHAYTKTKFSIATDEIFNKIQKQKKTHLIIFGIEAHVCVLQSVRDLIQRGFYVHIITDCISSRTMANKDNALLYMQNMGAVISNIETCLFDLMQDARHLEFKKISKIIK